MAEPINGLPPLPSEAPMWFVRWYQAGAEARLTREAQLLWDQVSKSGAQPEDIGAASAADIAAAEGRLSDLETDVSALQAADAALDTRLDTIEVDYVNDVEGPASATDNALPRFDGATGKLLQGSNVLVSDADAMSGLASLLFSGAGATALGMFAQGSWTPTIAGGSTAGTQTYAANGQEGRYVRVGDWVLVLGWAQLSAVDGAAAGYTAMRGLPFTPAAGTPFGIAYISYWSDIALSAGYTQLGGYFANSPAELVLAQTGSGMTSGFGVDISAVAATAFLNVAGIYRA